MLASTHPPHTHAAPAPAQAAVEKKRRLRRGRKRQVRLGETIFKGHRSYDLMLNLQVCGGGAGGGGRAWAQSRGSRI